ncbi:MAG: Mth938-like domain-containing protein [Allosphingosinicella sp.]
MPRFDRDSAASGPLVQGFTGTGFSVDGGVYRGLLLTPERASEWSAPPLAQLGLEDFAQILALLPAPEFLLLGTGAGFAFPPRALRAALEEKDIGLETMDSRAAARAWGMLRGEDRWIVAALMPME